MRLPLLAVLLGAALAAWALLGWWWGREYDARVAELRARGVPVDADDLRRPPPPEGDNARLLLEEWWAWWEPLRDEADIWAIAFEREDRPGADEHPLIAEARRRIGEAAAMHDLLRRALARPACFWAYDWDDGPEMRVMPIPYAQGICAYLDLRSRLFGAEATREGARMVLRFSETCDLPAAVGEMVEAVVQTVACDLVRRSAIEGADRAVALRAEFDPALSRIASRVDLPEAWSEERVLMLQFIGRMRAGRRGPGYEGVDRIYGKAWVRPLLLRSGLKCLDAFEEGAVLLALEPGSRAASIQAFERGLDDAGLLGAVARLWRDVPREATRTELEQRSCIAVTRVGLALLAHAEEHGTYPDSLVALEPLFAGGLPRDPSTGALLGWKRHADGTGVLEAAATALDRASAHDDGLAWTLPAR